MKGFSKDLEIPTDMPVCPGCYWLLDHLLSLGVTTVETNKGDVPIRKEYFQLWYMQGTPYALYDN